MSNKTHNLNATQNPQAISKYQRWLRLTWLSWLGYKGFLLPILLSFFLNTQPNIAGGIAWQLIQLIPAILFTPWVIKANSPYALLLGSMLLLVYFGASGVGLFTRYYAVQMEVLWVYVVDTLLILLVNLLVFKLLKNLPSMNK